MYKFANVVNKYENYVLSLSLKVYGLSAVVYKPQVEENLYGEVTFDEFDKPVATIKVLFDQPLIMLEAEGSVSLIDRYDQELVMRTTYELSEHDKVVVTLQDGKTLQVKVVNPGKAGVDKSSSGYKYYVSVV